MQKKENRRAKSIEQRAESKKKCLKCAKVPKMPKVGKAKERK